MNEPTFPGASLGLPATGRGSLAPWGSRFSALVIDWGAAMVVAIGLFGIGVMRDAGWRQWMILVTFGVQKFLLTALTGSSFGQLITKIGVTMLDGRPIGWTRSLSRAFLTCLVLPAIVVGAERRILSDILLGTVVVRRS